MPRRQSKEVDMQKVLVPNQGDHHRADAVVIGGGIIGVATAFWLSRAGVDTLVVEARDSLGSLTSAASIESFRLQFAEPAMSALAKQSVAMLEDFPRVVELPGYDIAIKHQGYLFLTADPQKVDIMRQAVAQYHKFGVTDSELLDGDEVRQRFPWISPKVLAATFRQKDGWFSAHEALQGFVKASRARFFINTRVTGIQTDDRGISAVSTDRGRISTRVVIDAAGPFAGKIAQMVGVDLPLEPVRRQKIHVANQPLVPPQAPLTMNVDEECYWRPETGGAFAGWLDPDEPVTEPLENPMGDWDFAAFCMAKVAEMTPFWNEIAEKLKIPDLNTSAGQYIYTPDDQPIIGPAESVPGFYVNCGYWAGIMLAPAAGKWVADLVTGRMQNKDNPLRLSRFQEDTTPKVSSFLSGRS
jgi:sarcosine oxidase subunit beta